MCRRLRAVVVVMMVKCVGVLMRMGVAVVLLVGWRGLGLCLGFWR